VPPSATSTCRCYRPTSALGLCWSWRPPIRGARTAHQAGRTGTGRGRRSASGRQWPAIPSVMMSCDDPRHTAHYCRDGHGESSTDQGAHQRRTRGVRIIGTDRCGSTYLSCCYAAPEPYATSAQGSARAMRAWQCRRWTTHGFRTLKYLLATTMLLPHVGGRRAPHAVHASVSPGRDGGLDQPVGVASGGLGIGDGKGAAPRPNAGEDTTRRRVCRPDD